MRISIKDPKAGRYYLANVTPTWAERHDNGALISCGLTVGERGAYSGEEFLSARSFATLKRQGKVKEIDKDTWNHMGCQSSCTRRGGPTCSW